MALFLPTLSMGSFGDTVRLLQGALNLWPQSRQPALSTDGSFGPKTGTKVREFQTASRLSSDGVVGPLTWAQLEPLVQQILKTVPLPTGDDVALGARIVACAETALAVLGWRESDTPSPDNPRIAAAMCAGTVGGQRLRQGGISLQQILMIAQVSGGYLSRCLTITPEAEAWWQKQTAEGTAWRNNNDLCAWCGIFCIYIYRCAGINVPGGWSNHNKNVWNETVFRRSGSPKNALPGSIAVIDGNGGRNHHFIVTENTGSSLSSIDGNSFGTIAGDYSKGCKSVIARNSYSYAQLKKEGVYFLFPAAV